MKVIVTYRNFHDIERIEIMPEVFFVRENETSEDALRRIWENEFNSAISESMFDETDPLNEDECWYEEDMAQIAWADGDTKEFYIVEVKDWR